MYNEYTFQRKACDSCGKLATFCCSKCRIRLCYICNIDLTFKELKRIARCFQCGGKLRQACEKNKGKDSYFSLPRKVATANTTTTIPNTPAAMNITVGGSSGGCVGEGEGEIVCVGVRVGVEAGVGGTP